MLDAFGHVSVRHPSDPGRYLLSRSRSPLLIEPGDILEYTLISAPFAAQGAACAYVIHGCISCQARRRHGGLPSPRRRSSIAVAGEPIVPVSIGARSARRDRSADHASDDADLLVVEQEARRWLGRHAAGADDRHGATVVGSG